MKHFEIPYITNVRTRIFDVKARPVAKERPGDMELIAPDDYLQWMFTEHRARFNSGVLGSLEPCQIRDYWSNISREDSVCTLYKVNDMLDDELSLCAPMCSYGDAVPVANVSGLSLKCVSARSLLGLGNAHDLHMLLYCIPTKLCVCQNSHEGV